MRKKAAWKRSGRHAGPARQAESWRRLGVLATKQGDDAAAAGLFARAIRLDPWEPAYYLNLGSVLERNGKTREALLTYRQCLEIDSGNAAAWLQTGKIFEAAGALQEAAASFCHATNSRSHAREAVLRLGNVYFLGGALDDAARAYERALRLDSPPAEAFHNLGVVRMRQARAKEAAQAYRSAVRLRPNYAEAHNNLGILCQQAEQFEEARDCYLRALDSRPDYSEARYNLALLLQEQDHLEEALLQYLQVLDQSPTAETMTNTGNTLLALGRTAEARQYYEAAVRSDPEHPQARWNLGLADLMFGEFERGWHGYEWRLRQPGAALRTFFGPQWNREPLEGRSIMLQFEQGLGDTIQFARFAPMVADCGGVVLLECQRDLAELAESAAGVTAVVEDGRSQPADLYVPLMSLPHRLGITLETLPAPRMYLRPTRSAVEVWEQRLRERLGDASVYKVGLAWSGNPSQRTNAKRSIPFGKLEALADLDTVRFINLQSSMNRAGAEPKGGVIVCGALEMLDFEPMISNLHERAALMAHLDLVITVDTSIAHLAGATGRQVWTLLPFAADWRWMIGRDDTPWYPSMRLFRQNAPGDWDSVLKGVRIALAEMLKQ
jgi:tetratricopeptide (TPR) repeat protein